jgi:hypothetical protein
MSATPARSDPLPHALRDGQELRQRLAWRSPAVFLDYDGTLTPIVERPDDAVISDGMREAVRRLAARCPVCVVSGRDRQVVQRLMASMISSSPAATALTSGARTQARSSTRPAPASMR